MASKSDATMSAMVTAFVASDPEIQQELRDLAHSFVAISKYTMQYGTLQERAQLSRIMAPALFKGLDGVDASAKNNEKAKAWERMKAAQRGELDDEWEYYDDETGEIVDGPGS